MEVIKSLPEEKLKEVQAKVHVLDIPLNYHVIVINMLYKPPFGPNFGYLL